MTKLLLTVVTDALYGVCILAALGVAAAIALLLLTQWVLWREKKRQQQRVREWCPICELLPDDKEHEHV